MTTILAYLEIALFLATEGRLRRGEAAKSLEQGQFDRNSTRRIGMAFSVVGLGLLAAPLLNWLRIGRLPWIAAGAASGASGLPRSPTLLNAAGWIGLIIGLLGIGLRAWANRTLGKFYTRTLQVTGDQAVVQNGPYRLVRHPGYLGMILLWGGTALATMNGLILALALLVMFGVYAYRIQMEERMLLTTLGEPYQKYRRHTWRLIPFIF